MIDILDKLKEIERLTTVVAGCVGQVDQKSLRNMCTKRWPMFPDRVLLLVNPVYRPGTDILDWTAIPPTEPDLHRAIANRIADGYLPLGLLSKEPVFAVFGDAVHEPYRRDFVRWANLEATIIFEVLMGRVPTELGAVEPTVLGDGNARKACLQFWRMTTDKKPN